MGLALALVIVIYGIVIFYDRRDSRRIDEAIRVKVLDSGSSQINPEVADE